MSKRLYVSNLGENIGDSDLETIFKPYGEVVSSRVIVDREANRSKGFGFVEMINEENALAAIAGLNDVMHDGRSIAVEAARPQAKVHRRR